MTNRPLPPRRVLLAAVHERDANWEGAFVFGVTTTGVACKPGCRSRRPLPGNVRFFTDLDDAKEAGFRPCRRCRPDEVDTEPDWWHRAVALTFATESGTISDDALRSSGIDPVRLRRYTRRRFGTTFHAWCRERRMAVAQRQLRAGVTVDQVAIKSGYESHSGFRDAFVKVTGRTPGRARDAEPISIQSIDSPLGRLVIGAVSQGICLLEFGEQQRVELQAKRLARQFGGPIVMEDHQLLTQLRTELEEYWSGARQEFSTPLAVRGTPFEEATWRALQDIPWGETRSYAQVAEMIGNPGAVRAVGSANGRNRIAIVVPCHRVVNASGELGGYGGGLWRKRKLLELEARS